MSPELEESRSEAEERGDEVETSAVVEEELGGKGSAWRKTLTIPKRGKGEKAVTRKWRIKKSSGRKEKTNSVVDHSSRRGARKGFRRSVQRARRRRERCRGRRASTRTVGVGKNGDQ